MSSYGTPEVTIDVPDVTFVGTKRHTRTNCTEENELLTGATGSHNSIKEEKSPLSIQRRGSETDLIEHLKGTTYSSCNGWDSQEMQDAPFDGSLSGSQDDMLEYEDPLISCDGCRRRRRFTVTEKCLLGFGAICLIVIVALAVAVGKKQEEKVQDMCESKGCLNAASSLVVAMDPTADPCEDFHQYSCGGWLRETPIPPGYPVWDRFQELSYKNMYMLKTHIESHALHGSAQNNVKRFYQSCMDESAIPRAETLSEFRELLRNLTDADGKTNVLGTLTEVHKLNTWPLFQLTVGPDERKADHNVIKIEVGASPFPLGIFKEPKNLSERSSNSTDTTATSTVPTKGPTTTPSTDPVVVLINASVSTNGSDTAYNVSTVTKHSTTSPPTTSTTLPSTTTKQPHIKETHPHPKENVSDLIRDYLTETALLLQTLLGKTEVEATAEADNLLQLEKKLSLAHDNDHHIHERHQAFNAMSLEKLQTKCPQIHWVWHLNDVLGKSRKITKTHEVVVLHEDTLLRVCSIIKEYSDTPSLSSTLQTYLLLSVARSIKPYFDMSTFQTDMDPDVEIEIDGEHWRRCTFYANRAMGLATGAIYVNASSSQISIGKVKTIVDYVKRAFKDYLLRKIWLDKKTKTNAAAKIDEMIEKVSYPLYILNNTFLDTYYKEFTVGTDWFQNLLNWRTFATHNMATRLNEQYDRTKSWINPPVTVESDYSPVRNDIIFPIALFHLPIFSADGPSALNFGAMGSLIGHEITHAFDIQGRQYDGYGRLRDWFDPVTADSFNQTTGCMKDQYDHFKIGNMTINGERTLEENIADNGGIRAAHIAYELWLKEHGQEQPLPGVKLNNRQMFYVSFAQLYCSKWKDAGIKNFLMRDTHSPGPFRIEGALANSFAFQQVFQCSYTSRYNPSTKCQVW